MCVNDHEDQAKHRCDKALNHGARREQANHTREHQLADQINTLRVVPLRLELTLTAPAHHTHVTNLVAHSSIERYVGACCGTLESTHRDV
jgi:hypothetical protein